MNILLDNKPIETLLPESLPMLIHGADKSGASMYTIALAAKWFSQSYDILFLCGFPMAEEAFSKLVDREKGQADFFTKEQVAEFIKKAESTTDKTIIVIKNIELFDNEPLQAILDKKQIILSGDINKASVKDDILGISFASKVYFSEFANVDISNLAKYSGLMISNNYSGITKLETE